MSTPPTPPSDKTWCILLRRYIFPSLGLGTVLSGASQVTDRMIEETSLALADALTAEETQATLLYPRIERILEISAEIAVKVIRAAQYEKLDTNEKLREMTDAQLLEYVKERQYKPSYEEDEQSLPSFL
jgi:malate dehydrogenase (oxaloacetate-decarboxylating)(NADP+)